MSEKSLDTEPVLSKPATAADELPSPALVTVCSGLLFSFVNAGRIIEE